MESDIKESNEQVSSLREIMLALDSNKVQGLTHMQVENDGEWEDFPMVNFDKWVMVNGEKCRVSLSVAFEAKEARDQFAVGK